MFASIANRREHGIRGTKNWMRAAHAELPVLRVQVLYICVYIHIYIYIERERAKLPVLRVQVLYIYAYI